MISNLPNGTGPLTFDISATSDLTTNVSVGDILVVPHDIEVPGVKGEFVEVVQTDVDSNAIIIKVKRYDDGAPGVEVDPTIPLSSYGINAHAFQPYKVSRHLQTTKLWTKTLELGIDGEKFLKFDIISDNFNTTGLFVKSLNPNDAAAGLGNEVYNAYVPTSSPVPGSEYTGSPVGTALFTNSDSNFTERVLSFPSSHLVYRAGDTVATIGTSGGYDAWLVVRNDKDTNNDDVQVMRGMLNTNLSLTSFGELQASQKVISHSPATATPGMAASEIKIFWTDRNANVQIVENPIYDTGEDDSIFMRGVQQDNYALVAFNTGQKGYSALQNYKQFNYIVNDTGLFLGYFPKNSPMSKLVGANRIVFEIDFIFRG